MLTVVTVGITPTLLAAAKSPQLRGNILIQLLPGGMDVWIARDPNVSAGAGYLMRANADAPCTATIENEAFSKPAAAAWYGIVASGTQTLQVEEGT